MDFEKIIQMVISGSTRSCWFIGLLDSFLTIVLHPFAFAMIVGTLAQFARYFDQTFRDSV